MTDGLSASTVLSGSKSVFLETSLTPCRTSTAFSLACARCASHPNRCPRATSGCSRPSIGSPAANAPGPSASSTASSISAAPPGGTSRPAQMRELPCTSPQQGQGPAVVSPRPNRSFVGRTRRLAGPGISAAHPPAGARAGRRQSRGSGSGSRPAAPAERSRRSDSPPRSAGPGSGRRAARHGCRAASGP